MTGIINHWFEIFASETGILGEMRRYQGGGVWVLLVLGLLTCLFGFKLYRGLFSISLFLFIALVSSVTLGSRMDWGSVVTLFSVAGVALAALGYGWSRLGGVMICFIAWAMMITVWNTSLWVILPAAAVFGILVLIFPVITISATTALWGGWVFMDALYLMTGNNGRYGVWVVLLAIAGFMLQLFISRKQKLFPKVCPDRLRYWMEKRRQTPA